MQISQKHLKEAVEFVVLSFDRYSHLDPVFDLSMSYQRSCHQLHGMSFLFPLGKEAEFISQALTRLQSIYELRVHQKTSPSQPGGVGRSLAQPSGAVEQVNTPHDSKCTCNQCTCMGFGFTDAPNECSESYPFVTGE